MPTQPCATASSRSPHPASILLFVLGLVAAGSASAEEADVPLLADPGFANGVVVWDPAPGKHVLRGTLQPWAEAGKPAWQLPQWHSRFTLANAKPETLPDGRVRFADEAKHVLFGKTEGVVLGLDAIAEYQGKAPAKGEPWPHLLLSQRRLLHHPSLPELAAVPFRIRYRLLEAEPRKGPGWDDRRHTAQVVFYVTVQNLNRQSAGYGDYLWFGIRLYDLRFPWPKQMAMPDIGSQKKQGTGKFMYAPAFARLARRSPHDKQWVEIDADLLPFLEEALAAAWERGYLKDSRDRGDYRLGGMNMGWEITGPVRAAVQFGSISLAARLRE